jgi:DNA invertase Pin-like site-specific DNA recombinase
MIGWLQPGRKRIALYLRVSTSKQDTHNQRRELEAVAARSGWEIVRVFQDNGISGAKGRDGRPGLDAMLKAVNAREFDLVAAWSVDRLGRSLTDLLSILQHLKDKGVDLFLHQQGLDTSTTAGKAMFQMLGVFAEFERGIIKERVNAGLARARANGTKLGRGNRKDGKASADEKRWGMSTAAMEKKIKALHRSGMGMLRIGRELGVGRLCPAGYFPFVLSPSSQGLASPNTHLDRVSTPQFQSIPKQVCILRPFRG